MAKDLLDFSKFKKIFEDDKNTHLKHPKGHTIIVAHVALNPKLKKQIADLPLHPEKMLEMAKDIMEQLPHQKMAEGGKAEKPAVSRLDMNYKDVTKRIPQLTEAANKIAEGKLSAAEYDSLVNKHKPVEAYGFVPQPASREDAMRALNESKRKMYGKTSEMTAGEPADLRLDIPAYKDHGVWVNSIHRKDAPTVYGSVSSVKNAQMVPSSEKALRVAAGGPKAPFAVIRGEWNPMEEQEAVEQAQKFLNHKDWKQVGYDPERHGYFYDRESMQPIEGAEQVIQIGPLVLAKKPRYGKKEEQLFADGGEVDKPFKGYNSEKHSRTGGLNDEYREKYNREHGSNLKRPVTGTPEAGSKDAARKKSFCARMKGVKGPTSEGGELTPKGAALKRWNCHAHGGMIEDEHDEECEHYAKGGRTSALLDEKGRKINKRSERERIFGSDANAPRMSDERMRMMNMLRDKVKQEYGVGLRTAAGKRTESGEIRDEGVQPAFDVYTPEGREAERRYVAEQKALNPKFKRIDPKPDWNNPDKFMDTQPSPDAGIHEVAHARQIPLGMTLAEHQDAMDALQGQVQKDYGFLQNKRTSHEIQPMAMENSIRRELGFPANSSIATGTARGYMENPETLAEHNAGRVSRGQPALETNEEGIPLTHDTKEPMYVAGLDHKGNVVYYMRQSRLMSPENRQRTEDIRQRTVKYHPERGMVESMSPDALINLRGQGRMAEAESRLRNRGDERFAEGGPVPSPTPRNEEAFKRNAREFEKGFNAGEDFGKSFQNLKSALGFYEGGQVGMDAIKKENYYNGGAIRHYTDAGFVDPMTEEEQQYAPQNFGMDMTEPSRAPASDFPTASEMPQQPAEPDFAKMVAEQPANPYENKFKQYRQEAEAAVPVAARGLKPGMSSQQLDEWALNKTREDKHAAEQQQKQAQMQQSRMDTYQQQLEKNNQAKMQYLGIQAPSRGVAGEPAQVGGGPATVGQAPSGEMPSGFGGPSSKAPAAGAAPSIANEMQGQDTYTKGLSELLGGVYEQGEGLAKIEKAKETTLNTAIAEQQQIKNRFDNLFNSQIEQNNALVDQYMNQRIDPMAVWNDRSAPAKVATAIGLILGGIGGGLTRQENPAMKFLQYQIDKSIEGQKMELGRSQNLLTNNLNMYRNMSDAMMQTRAQVAEITARQIERDAAKYGDEVQRALMHQRAGEIRMKNIFGPFQVAAFAKQLQNPASSDLERQTILRQVAIAHPEKAQAFAQAEVPNYMMANGPVDRGTREALNAFNTFDQRATELVHLLEKYQGQTYNQIYRSLSIPQRETIQTMADELLPQLADSNRIQVSEGTKSYLQDQISKGNPASLWNAFVNNNAALRATIEGSDMKHRQLISSTFGEENTPALFEKNKIRNRRIALQGNRPYQNTPTGVVKKINRTPME
jgi:hypothetical protein